MINYERWLDKQREMTMGKETSHTARGTQDKPGEVLTRRDFLRYSSAAGGAFLLGLHGGLAMANPKSRVAFVQTEDRKSGVGACIKALGMNTVRNKDVLIKPNFNTADPVPGSSDNETLVSLVQEVWKMGAKSVSLGERSYPPTGEVMEDKGVIPLMKELDVNIVNFDDLEDKDWVEFKPKDSHWQNGFRIARPVLETECLVS
jgi:hypothetical protein